MTANDGIHRLVYEYYEARILSSVSGKPERKKLKNPMGYPFVVRRREEQKA